MRVVWLLVPLIVVGCASACAWGNGSAGSTPSPAPSLGPSDLCVKACGRVRDCGGPEDPVDCESRCEDGAAKNASRMRPDVIDGAIVCVSDEACRAVRSSSFVAKCIDEAAASLGSTDRGDAFCDAWARSAARCGTTLDASRCRAVASVYADAALADAESCTQKPCSDVVACILIALGEA